MGGKTTDLRGKTTDLGGKTTTWLRGGDCWEERASCWRGLNPGPPHPLLPDQSGLVGSWWNYTCEAVQRTSLSPIYFHKFIPYWILNHSQRGELPFFSLGHQLYYIGLPGWCSGKELAYQCRRHKFFPTKLAP